MTFPDFEEFIASLNAHRVRYLVVGGYAVGFHARPRATKAEFLGLNDLVASKKAAGRLQDLADVEVLERAQQRRKRRSR